MRGHASHSVCPRAQRQRGREGTHWAALGQRDSRSLAEEARQSPGHTTRLEGPTRARPPMPPLAKSKPLWHALSRGPRPEVRLSPGTPRSPTARPRGPGHCGSAVSLHRARPHKPPGRREVCETRAARLRVGGRGQPVARGTGAWAAPGARSGKSWRALVQTRVSDRMVCRVLGPRGKGRGHPETPRRATPAPRQPRGGGFPQCPASSSPHFRCPAAHGGAEAHRPSPRPPPPG